LFFLFFSSLLFIFSAQRYKLIKKQERAREKLPVEEKEGEYKFHVVFDFNTIVFFFSSSIADKLCHKNKLRVTIHE
jgi:hypothetical protein